MINARVQFWTSRGAILDKTPVQKWAKGGAKVVTLLIFKV